MSACDRSETIANEPYLRAFSLFHLITQSMKLSLRFGIAIARYTFKGVAGGRFSEGSSVTTNDGSRFKDSRSLENSSLPKKSMREILLILTFIPPLVCSVLLKKTRTR